VSRPCKADDLLWCHTSPYRILGRISLTADQVIVEVEGVEVAGFVDGWPIGEFVGWPIAAPSPPGFAAGTVVELLPFFASIVGINRRSTIQPNFLGLDRGFEASGTVEFKGMGGLIGPFGRSEGESIHSGDELLI
jgi:hypothetical protein